MKSKHLMILVFSCILLTACANDMNNPTPQDTSPVPTVSVEASEIVTEAPSLTPTKKPTKKPTKAPTRTPTPTVTPRPILHGDIPLKIENAIQVIYCEELDWSEAYDEKYWDCNLTVEDYTVSFRTYEYTSNDPKEEPISHEDHVFFTTLDQCEFWIYVYGYELEDGRWGYQQVTKEDFLLYVARWNYYSEGPFEGSFRCGVCVKDGEIVRIVEQYMQ